MYGIISFLSILLVKCIEGAMERETIDGDKHTWLDGKDHLKEYERTMKNTSSLKRAMVFASGDGGIPRVRSGSPFKYASSICFYLCESF